jgi:hypothetical protein
MSYGTAVLNQFTRRPGFRLLRTRSASAPRQRPGDGAEQRSTCKRGARDISVGACLQPLCPVNEWHSDIFVDHRTYLKSAFAAVDLDVQHSMRLPLQGPRDERPDASPELHVASQALPSSSPATNGSASAIRGDELSTEAQLPPRGSRSAANGTFEAASPAGEHSPEHPAC